MVRIQDFHSWHRGSIPLPNTKDSSDSRVTSINDECGFILLIYTLDVNSLS